MKRDIRTLFKDGDIEKKLPENHRQEFEEKLTTSPYKKNKFLKFAAVVVLFFSIGFYTINKTSEPTEKKSVLLVEIQQIEKEYLKNIDDEWQNFIGLTNDSLLIKKYENKLKLLTEDYQKLSKSLNKQPNNTEVLEDLIENLQRRLSILKEIKEHLKTFKTTPRTYETIIL